jgi:hypothetical protein
MKDSEFIELLNLYLDHEISPEDSARLEAEVNRDPARRRVYRQYCRMQKACVVLADHHRESAPAQGAMAAAFAPRPAWADVRGLWTAGLMAAAAGLAVIALSRHGAVAPAVPGTARAVPAAPALAASAVPSEFHPVFVARALALDPATPSPSLTFVSADAGGQFAWMDRVQIAPVQLGAAGGVFVDPKPRLDFDAHAAEAPAAAPQSVEETAFQFHK